MRGVAPAPGGTQCPQMEPPGAVGEDGGEADRRRLDVLRRVGHGRRGLRPLIRVTGDVGAPVPVDDYGRIRRPAADYVARAPQRRIGRWRRVDLERAQVDRHRPVAGVVADAEVEPPVTVGERVACRSSRGLLNRLCRSRIGVGLLRPAIREPVDAAVRVCLAGPDDLDGRVVRPRIDGVARARERRTCRRRPVDLERAEVDGRAPVADRVDGAEVEPPGSVRERDARGGRRGRVLRRVRRGRRALRPFDRVARDAASRVRRAAPRDIDRAVGRPVGDVRARERRVAGNGRVQRERAQMNGRAPVAGVVAGAEVEPPLAVGERRARRAGRALLGVLGGMGHRGRTLRPLVGEAVDAARTIRRARPSDVDRWVTRPSRRGMVRAGERRIYGRDRVDVERAQMDGAAPVSRVVAGAKVEPPLPVGERRARRPGRRLLGILDRVRKRGRALRPLVREAVDAATRVRGSTPRHVDGAVVRPTRDRCARQRRVHLGRSRVGSARR